MDTSSKYDPWELIAESLTGDLTIEHEHQLQHWLSSDPENKRKYLQIRELWKNGMEDYRFYKMANETEAWKALRMNLKEARPERSETRYIQGQFNQKSARIRNLLAIAAVFLGLVGIGLWYFLVRDNTIIYETAYNVHKRITLIDGSVITLKQQTKIEVPRDYNVSQRSVTMTSGDASFEVVHNADKSFTVDLGTTQIRDIGTSFTIHKEEKKIDVAVSSGKVEFVKISTKESRELSAGTGITFDAQSNSFGDVFLSASGEYIERLLTFENTSLSEVIKSVQSVYGKKVIINDSIAGKRFTGQLYGMTYDAVIKVLCQSLGLDYSLNDSIYMLKAKTNEQP